MMKKQGMGDRPFEEYAMKIMPSLSVAVLARAMINDALSPPSESQPAIYLNRQLRSWPRNRELLLHCIVLVS